jgi:hypothetical protein
MHMCKVRGCSFAAMRWRRWTVEEPLPVCEPHARLLELFHWENFRRWWRPSVGPSTLRHRVAEATAVLHIELREGLTLESEAFSRFDGLLHVTPLHTSGASSTRG